MKKTILRVSVICVLSMPASYSLPVIDASQLYENVQTVARWVKQGKQWKKEIDNWKKDYAAITGFRLEGDIMAKFTQLNTMLNDYGLDMGSLDLDNPKSQIGVYAKDLFKTLTVFDDCNYDYMTDKQTEICEDTIKREVQEIATVAAFSQEITGVMEKLNKLNEQLKDSEDVKTSQDITAAVESTVSTLEIMSAKFDMMNMKNEAKEAIDRRQKKQIYMEKYQLDNVNEFYKKRVL